MIDLTDVRVTVLPHGEGLALPAHAEPHAAGLDLRAAVPADAPLTLAPGAHALVPTGLQIALPDGTEGSGEPTMRCHEGASFWLGDEGHRALDGRFGPGFATFVGWLPTGELVDLYRVAP